MERNKSHFYDNLDETYYKVWELLNSGLKNRNASFHIPTFISGSNNEFDGRIVVLRGINEKQKKIWFHSDIRSNKVKIIKSNPKSVLLFYDKVEKIQMRVSGISKINYQNEKTKISWDKIAHMSRQCYLGSQAPGTKVSEPTSGLTADFDNLKYTIEESEAGCKNFCVVDFFINSIEWLYLASKGHRRAYFAFEKKRIKKEWLIP